MSSFIHTAKEIQQYYSYAPYDSIKTALWQFSRIFRGHTLLWCAGKVMRLQNATRSEIEEIQNQKLRELVTSAIEKIPYYQKACKEKNITASQIQTVQDLKGFPILEKKTVKDQRDSLLTPGIDINTLVPFSTGGTTGEPTRIYLSKEAVDYAIACEVRAFYDFGYKLGSPMLILSGGQMGVIPTTLKGKISDVVSAWCNNRYLFPAFELESKKIDHILHIIKKYNIRFGMGYSSAWLTFAELLEQKGLKLQFDAVFATAEPLFDTWTEKIREYIAHKVVDFYGSAEITALGFKKPDGECYYVPDDHVYLEVLHEDGSISSQGKGELLITNLDSCVMPLIRYRNGDEVELGHPDLSQSPFSRIIKLWGRSFDRFYRTDGQAVSGAFVSHLVLVTKTPFTQFQMVQNEIGQIEVRYLPSPLVKNDHLFAIEKTLKRLLGMNTNIFFSEVSDLPKTPAGKRRFAVSHVTEEQVSRYLQTNKH